MTQIEKELLMKDISCRIPYGVIVNVSGISNVKLTSLSWYGEVGVDDGSTNLYPISEIKPYLFPLSNMTKEQRKYINHRWGINDEFNFEVDANCSQLIIDICDVRDYINWLIKNHFDVYGLIPKGLAIDGTELNLY